MQNKQRILFLCTGNYYRSRFAEEYFNHKARKYKLDWIADSRGLAREITRLRNPGPISKFAKASLFWMRIRTQNIKRYPIKLDANKIKEFDRIIAMSKKEHEPMVLELFPDYQSQIEYFEIGDTDVEDPPIAIKRLRKNLDKLIAELKNG